MNELPRGVAAWLPDDLGRLRAVEARVRAVFEARGYREVKTPAFEYADVVAAGIGAALADRLFRFTDVTGKALALRPEMTTPCARLFAATLAQTTDGPVRLHYVADVWRQAREYEGQPREFRQAGVEAYRTPGPAGDAEAVGLLVEALEAAGLADFRVEVGHVGIVRAFDPSPADLEALRRKDTGALRGPLAEIARSFGGPEVLDRPADRSFKAALDDLRALHAALPPGARRRVGYDLGIVRDPAYYNGIVFEGLSSGAGRPVAGGGRYDGLTAAFGAPAPAIGFAIDLDAILPALKA